MSLKSKIVIDGKCGFTLVEILLVIAIIGILASTLYIAMGGQRERARAHSALESVRSTLPYAVDCYMKNNQPIRRSAGGNVCNPDNGFDWPVLNAKCSYLGNADISGDFKIADCGTATGLDVYCNVETKANCWLE